jgi:ribosomal-protein-alanine N-acetyltransferase
MRPPSHFETARLQFAPVALRDASAIFEGYARHSGPTRYMNWVRHQSLSESEAYAARCVRCWESGSAFPWALRKKGEGDYVGTIELRIAPPKADFGYILSEWAWGRGYATEAASAVVGWALEQTSIFRVWATCHPDNRASIRVLEKAGLRYETRLENWEARPQAGQLAGPSIVYALIKEAK